MEQNTTDIWKEFFGKLPQLRKAITPYAERSGISVHSAILLTVCSEFPDIDIPVRDEFNVELENKGLIKFEGDKAVITSKGAILAKSFAGIKKSIF